MNMRRLLLAAAAATLLLPAAGTAAPAPPKSCTSGATWIEREPGVRIFQVELFDRAAGFKVPYLYGCSKRIRKPKLVGYLSPATTQEIQDFGGRGSRILFESYEYADGGGGSSLGWWDHRTGRRAERVLNNVGGADFGQTIHHAVLAADGSIAYVRTSKTDDDDNDTEYSVYFVRYAGGKFEKEKRLARAAPAEIDPQTLAIDGDTVTWRTVGAERTLAIPPDTSMRAATPAPPRKTYPGTCRKDAGEGVNITYLTDSLPVRLFRAASGKHKGIWACRAEDRTPGRYVMPANRSLALTAQTSKVLAFLAKPRGGDGGILGWFEPKAGPSFLVRTIALAARTSRIVAVFPDPANGIVILDDAARLSFVRAFASGFDPEAELAQLTPAEIEPRTLKVSKGVARWRIRGEARSAPLPS